jgi:hypothetical protein
MNEKDIDDVLYFMELYYTQEWFDRHDDKQLLEEFYMLYNRRILGKA